MDKSQEFINRQDGIGLQEHLEKQIAALKELHASEIKNIRQEAVTALTAMNERLGGMNEFRETLTAQAKEFATNGTLDLRLTPIINDIRFLRETQASLAGKASQQSVTNAQMLAVVSTIIALAGIVIALFGG